MNTYHVAFTRVKGRPPIQMKIVSSSLHQAVRDIEELMPVDDRDGNTLLGELIYVIKVDESP